MAGRRRVGESQNVKFKYYFDEVSLSINLAAPRREAGLASDSYEMTLFDQLG